MSTTSSHNFLLSTVARNLDANKNAPLNFLLIIKINQTGWGTRFGIYAPVEGVRFPWRRRETMMQHGRDPLSDLGGDTSPCRTRPKREWLFCALAERRREQLQRLNVGGFHDLMSQSIRTEGG